MNSIDVLIVEPSIELAGVLSDAFQQKGLSCEVAHSAQDGIHLADIGSPKLIVLELIMPRHNGMEFIHELRSYKDWLDIPLILYTHVSRDELQLDAEMMKDIGIVGHLYKPTTSLDKLITAAEAEFALDHN